MLPKLCEDGHVRDKEHHVCVRCAGGLRQVRNMCAMWARQLDSAGVDGAGRARKYDVAHARGLCVPRRGAGRGWAVREMC